MGATGFGHEHGVEGRVKSGNLVVKEGAASGQLVFDLRSFQADSSLARKAVGLKGDTADSTAKQVTDNMLGSGVLDTDHFPTATFVLESAARPAPRSDQGGDVYELSGKLVLHGVTRPLKFRVRSVADKGSSRFTGSFKLLQTEFGITPFSKALGAVGVADELTIIGDLWLSPSPGQARPKRSNDETGFIERFSRQEVIDD